MNQAEIDHLRALWLKDLRANVQGLTVGRHARSGLTIGADGRVLRTWRGAGARLLNGLSGSATYTTVTAGSTAQAAWTATDVAYDDLGYWDAGDPSRLTAPVDGRYLVTAHGAFALLGATTAGLVASLATNAGAGAGQIGRAGLDASWGSGGAGYTAGYGASALDFNFAGIVEMAAGQYVEITGQNITGTGSPSAELRPIAFCIEQIG